MRFLVKHHQGNLLSNHLVNRMLDHLSLLDEDRPVSHPDNRRAVRQGSRLIIHLGTHLRSRTPGLAASPPPCPPSTGILAGSPPSTAPRRTDANRARRTATPSSWGRSRAPAMLDTLKTKLRTRCDADPVGPAILPPAGRRCARFVPPDSILQSQAAGRVLFPRQDPFLQLTDPPAALSVPRAIFRLWPERRPARRYLRDTSPSLRAAPAIRSATRERTINSPLKRCASPVPRAR